MPEGNAIQEGEPGCASPFFQRFGSPLLVAIIGFALFAGTLDNPFTSDDIWVVEETPQLHSGNLFRTFFVDLDRPMPEDYPSPRKIKSRPGLYRPILAITYILDRTTSNENTFGWRLTSLLLHIIASLLVLTVARMLLRSELGALVAALFFVAHPTHTETVAMLVGGRSELLATIFVLAAWRLFLAGDTRTGGRRWAFDIGSAGLFLLGLWSKENVAVLPGIILLCGYALRGQNFKTLLVRMIPYLVVFAFYLTIRLVIIGRVAPISWSLIFGELPGIQIVLAMMTVMAYYLRLVLVPYPLQHQACYHNLPSTVSVLEGVLCTLLVLGLIGASLWWTIRCRRRGKQSWWAFGLLFFYGCLVPVSHLVPFWVIMAERFIYLPSVALCLLAGHLAIRARALRRWIPAAVCLPLLAGYGFVTVDRNADWGNLDRLWTKAAACNPNFHGPVSLMGTARLRQGKPAEALEFFKKAASINPDNPSPHYNMGVAYQQLGRLQEAARSYQKALALTPVNALDFTHSKSWNNLGMVMATQGHMAEAKKCFQEAVEIDPTHHAHHVNLGNILQLEGNYAEAEKRFRLALEMVPTLIDARFNLARLLEETGRREEAERLYREIIGQHPGHAMAHNNLANILRDRQQLEQAESHYHMALKADPKCLPTLQNLATFLLAQGKHKDAADLFVRALRLNPKNVQALVGLGQAHLRRGRRDLAMEAARRAVALNPGDPAVQKLMAAIRNTSD